MTCRDLFIMYCVFISLLLSGCQSTYELSKDPKILTKEFGLDELRLFSLKLGDPASKIPQDIIIAKESGWIKCKGDIQFHIIDGNIEEFMLGQDFLRRLEVTSEDHIQVKIGFTETIVEYGLFGKPAVKFYIYPSRNMAIEWHRLLDDENNHIVIGPSVTKQRYEERRKEQQKLNDGLDLVAKYENEGRYNESIKLLEELIELQPENPGTRNLLGRSYFFNKEYDKAEQEFKAVISMSPPSTTASKAYQGLSWIYRERKDTSAAKDAIEKAIKLDPTSELSIAAAALLQRPEKTKGEKLSPESEFSDAKKKEIYAVYIISTMIVDVAVKQSPSFKSVNKSSFVTEIIKKGYGDKALNSIDSIIKEGNKKKWAIPGDKELFEIAMITYKAIEANRLPNVSEIQSVARKIVESSPTRQK